jgi:hypothetical protein
MNALVACIYRQPSMVTYKAILDLLMTRGDRWRVLHETGDALISRARSVAASHWLRAYPDDDVLVMTDDDFYFTPDGLEALASLARQTKGIVAGVTPLRSGEYTAIVPLEPSADEPWRDPACPPMPIKWAGGLIAYHRSVFERLTHAVPLLHKHDPRMAPWWPFFMPAAHTANGDDIYLSEDYACHERARRLGIEVWVQPACQVTHLAEVPVTSATMSAVQALFMDATVGGVYADPHLQEQT